MSTEIIFATTILIGFLALIHCSLAIARCQWVLDVYLPKWRSALNSCDPNSPDFYARYDLVEEFKAHHANIKAASGMIDRGNYIKGYQKWKQAVAEAELIFIKVNVQD